MQFFHIIENHVTNFFLTKIFICLFAFYKLDYYCTKRLSNLDQYYYNNKIKWMRNGKHTKLKEASNMPSFCLASVMLPKREKKL